jgi:dTDP-4-amino-4,6-dideoxygalactose transaminase/ribosomal protein S18 acetylase RimI-like enzyme
MKRMPAVIPHPKHPRVRLRLAGAGDSELLRTWKNRHKASFFHQQDITPEQQAKWFEGYLQRPDDFQYVVEEEAEFQSWAPIGIVAGRLLDGTVDLYNIMRGRESTLGLGKIGEALTLMCQAIQDRYREPITCKVLADNPARGWYEQLGFAVAETHEGYHLLRYAKTHRMISVFGSKVGAEELAEVKDCIDRQWLGTGPKTKAFEQDFAKRQGFPNTVLVNSGSNALHLAMTLLNLPPGSDVIVPSFTWVSCAHAVVLAGHHPVFCDVELETQNPTAETIRAAMTPKTKAIMVVHYAGKPVQMKPILDLGLPVVEDVAHAVDSKLDGKYCGAIGAIGVFSFDAIKNLAMGEGGAITAQDPQLAERARTLRYCGIGKSGFEASTGNKERWWEYNVAEFFPKFLISDVSAAIGLAQLRKLDTLQATRKRIWDLYQKEFAGLDWLKRPVDAAPNEQHSYFSYVIRIPKRDRCAKLLYERGIYTTLRYHPLHLNPIYKSTAKLPNSERLNEEALSIPLHPNLSDAEVEKIVGEVRALPKHL